MKLKKRTSAIIFLVLILILFGKYDISSQTNSFNDRNNLKVPDELWNYLLSNVGHEDKILGYTYDEMNFFKFYGNEFRLKFVWDLFRDVRKLNSAGAEIGDFFLENYENPWSITDYCYKMLEVENETETRINTENFQAREISEDDFEFETPMDKENWNNMPMQIKTFIMDVIKTTLDSSDIVQNAFDKTFLAQKLGVDESALDNIDRLELYEFISEPWKISNPSASSFDSMYEIDFDALSDASYTFTSGISNALTILKDWINVNKIPESTFDMIRFISDSGNVCILGNSDQVLDEEYSIVIDLGGNDSYMGSHAVPRSFSNSIGLIIDLSGNDRYISETGIAELCSGLFGIGAIFDLKGDDEYSCGESGLASAWQGTGLLFDYEGNDKYDSNAAWSLGSAHAGVGLLMDLDGNDDYSSTQQSLGFGSSLGIGAILDVSGNDKYRAEGVWSEPFQNNTAFCMGAGFGRRADFTDRRSLAGGVGIMVEGDGDDTYWGPVYVIGCGYWWAAGFFEDRGGNDKYRCLQYSIGSAPHMAIGCAVDLVGDDRYNVDEGYTVCQYQGCGRDGCLGIFIDGEGNDQYFFRSRCAGAGDLNSIAFFWDRFGDDVYMTAQQPWAGENDKSFGGSFVYEPSGNKRDEIITVGIFLDSDGHDVYNIDPFDDIKRELKCADNKQWHHNNKPVFWGYGLDIDWFSSKNKE